MKDAGKELLIEVLGLNTIPGMVEAYERAGFFAKADTLIAANILGGLEAFVHTLKVRPVYIDPTNADWETYAATLAEVGNVIDDHHAIVEEAILEGLSV